MNNPSENLGWFFPEISDYYEKAGILYSSFSVSNIIRDNYIVYDN